MDFVFNSNVLIFDVKLNLMLALFGVAVLAGFIDAIAGGGGLLTLPALFIAGIHPVAAIATNKFQAASATVSATSAFAKKGMIDWKYVLPMMVMAALGSFVGALSISFLPKSVLEACVPIMLILVALYFALSPKITNDKVKEKLSVFVFSLSIIPLLGFYDGVFGPGVGSFVMMAFVSLLGLGILNAMAHTKAINAVSNIGALAVFAWKGVIVWPIAIAMALGAFVGAQLGTRCAVREGVRLIKPMLVVMCCLMAIRLLLNEENPLRKFIGSWLW